MSGGFSVFVQTVFPTFVKRASPEAARRLILSAGVLYYAAHRDERRLILSGVADLLGSSERTEAVQRRVLPSVAEHYFEKLLVATKGPERLRAFVRERVEIDSPHRIDEALARGRGVLAVTAHWGAVELIPAILVERGYPVTVVLEAKTQRLRRRLERLAVDSGVELLISSRGDQVLGGILSALARGRVLVTQVDEVDSWRRRKSRTIRLFDKELFFDHSLDFIAKRSRAPAVGLFCGREGGLRYRLSCEPIAQDPLAANVAEAALRLWERYTMKSPEQWYQWAKWEAMKAPAG